MKNPALFRVVNRIVQDNAAVQPAERVCVVSDSGPLALAEVFVEVAAGLGADPVLALMAPRNQHGQEVPAAIAGAMVTSDVVFQVVSYAMTHTDATQQALQAGARVLVLRGVSEDLMLHGAINADYDAIGVRCASVLQWLKDARSARVRTPRGTDLTMDLSAYQPKVLDGRLKGPGTFAAMPDGETAMSPTEGSTEGTLVIEHTMDGLGLLDEPIRMQVKQGRVVSIEGGSSAKRLQGLLEGAGEGATNIAEFAIGTNPNVRLIGNMAEDKKLEGSVHIALGDNHVLGGTVKSQIHFDGLLLTPTVELDGAVVIERGRFV